MKIRAITGFLDPGWPINSDRIKSIASVLDRIKEGLTELDYEVQTTRIATPPPAEMSTSVAPRDRSDFGQQLEAQCFMHGIDYANIGPALPDEPEGFEVIPELIGKTENIFACGIYADMDGGLAIPAARAVAEVITQTSKLTEDGFSNLRFAGLANVPPGSPFFPAAYHLGGQSAVALATESADLAVDSMHSVTNWNTARRRLVGMIEAHATALTRIVEPITTQSDVRFLGIDFSLAPYPDASASLGTAFESLGAPATGLPGTLAAAAFLADCLDQARFQRTGFCGLFLPVLEDANLALRNSEGHVSLSDLLLYSTVCGTGLDTIPLPGDVEPEELLGILVDLGTLALRHNKPLTARLMPIPNKNAGDEVRFDFPFFAVSQVMSLDARPLKGLLAGEGSMHVGPKAVL
jgi:uncharacterized protein (UPF0210 family)